MDCNKCTNLLYKYLDNELDDELRLAIETHLDECNSCQMEWREIQESINIYCNHVASTTMRQGFSEQVIKALSKENDHKAFTIPVVAFALFLSIFVLTHVFFAPLFYPIFRMMFRLATNLFPLPGMLLAASPLLLGVGLTVLLIVFMTLTWATRRAIIS